MTPNAHSVTLNQISESEERVFRKIGWRLLPILMLGFVAAQLDRVNVGFAKLQMLSDLGFSDAVYGLGAGIFFIGYFIFEVPSNMVMPKVGARRWIARIMVSWGAISACTLLVHTPWQFYLVRFLLGAAEAGFAPGIIWYLANWFPAKQRGRAMALFLSSIPVAGVIGAPISGWVLSAFAHTPPFAAWQWLLLIEAIPAVVLGIAILFYLDDSVRTARWLNDDERAMVVARIAQEDKEKHSSEELWHAFKLPCVWGMSILSFCMIMGLYALNFWLPSLVKRAGVQDVKTIGWLVAIPYLVAVICNLVAGYSADRTGKRRVHFCLAMLVGAAGLSMSMYLNGGPTTTIICLSIAAAGAIPAVVLFWAFPAAMLAGTTAATGIAVLNSVGNLAGFVSPYLVGTLNVSSGRTDLAMYVIAAFMVAGGLGAMLLPRKVDV
ncbi:MFS transporter [Paraburkholderia azotifigens]|uniref:MFS transporter n=1 Tax=Paraburkholderia azotifigens TaxID=2057004 RepID=A0ABU9REJ0_9BURK